MRAQPKEAATNPVLTEILILALRFSSPFLNVTRYITFSVMVVMTHNMTVLNNKSHLK